MNEVLSAAEKAFSFAIEHYEKNKSKIFSEEKYRREFVVTSYSVLDNALKDLNLKNRDKNVYRRKLVYKFVEDVGKIKGEEARRDTINTLSKSGVDLTDGRTKKEDRVVKVLRRTLFPPSKNPSINDNIIRVYNKEKDNDKKIKILSSFLYKRLSINHNAYSKSLGSLKKSLGKNETRETDFKNLEAAIKIINPQNIKISEELYNKYKKLNVEDFAKKIVEEIPKLYSVKTHQNFIRWMQNTKEIKDPTYKEKMIKAVKDEWENLNWQKAEKEVGDSSDKSQASEKTNTGFERTGEGKHYFVELKKTMANGDVASIEKNFYGLLENTNFIKSDRKYYRDKKKNEKPIYLEVKNRRGSHKDLESALSGNRFDTDAGTFGTFISLDTGSFTKEGFKLLSSFIEKNKEELNERLSKEIKKQISKLDGNIRYFIVLKDVEAQKEQDIRVNLRKHENKAKFYFIIDSDENRSSKRIRVGLKLLDLGSEHLFDYKKAIKRRLGEAKLLKLKRIILEGLMKWT